MGSGFALAVLFGYCIYCIGYWFHYTFGWPQAVGRRLFAERSCPVCCNLMATYCPASVVVTDQTLTLWLGYHWRSESEGRAGPSFGMFYVYSICEVVATAESNISGQAGVNVSVPGGTLGTVRNWLILSRDPRALAEAISPSRQPVARPQI